MSAGGAVRDAGSQVKRWTRTGILELLNYIENMKTSSVRLLFAGLALVTLNTPLHAQPVIISQPVNPPVVWGGNATFSVVATGLGPLTYQWQLNGTNLPNNIITTVAGGQLSEGAPATNIVLGAPPGAAVDALGNLYIADKINEVVRKVGTNGFSKIIAGTGLMGFSGDGGTATNAWLNFPSAVAVDTNGNLFIADTFNYRIRKVDTNGTITTVAGNGSSFSPYGDGGAATNAALPTPTSVALDGSGNLYIADSQNHTIRKVDTFGNISTVAGINSALGSFSGDNFSAKSAHLNAPSSVAVDKAGNLFIADTFNYRIRKVTAATQNISTIAGNGTAGYAGDGGSATSAKISAAYGIAADTHGNVFVADAGNQVIRKITNGIITTVAGNGVFGYASDGSTATNASLAYPLGVAVDRLGNLFIADSANNMIRKVGTNGNILTVAGRWFNEGEPATNACLSPIGLALDSVGNVYVADNANHRIRKVDTNGNVFTVAGNGMPAFTGNGGPATNASVNNPWGVSVDNAGNLLIADQGNRRIRKVDTNGTITILAGKGTANFSGDGGAATNAGMWPQGVAADAFGNCFVLDTPYNRIRKVDTNGTITTVAGNGNYAYTGDGGPATNAAIAYPISIWAAAGGNLFIAQQSSPCIRKVEVNGIISTIAGNGTSGDAGDGGLATNALILAPGGVSTDPAGNIFISDGLAARVRKVGTTGVITTIAGNGVPGVPVDNVVGNSASLVVPRGTCLDRNGNLYIADVGSGRIRKLSYVDYANQPSFTLTNATTDSLGNHYTVIVTSASGSVTSSVVTVNLQLPPIAPAFTASNGVCSFTWSAVSNQTYQLEYTTNLVAPNWIDLGSPITATNNSVSTTDAVAGDGQRFYRVRLWP